MRRTTSVLAGLLLGLLVSVGPVRADDAPSVTKVVVVTATRLPQEVESTGATVSVLSDLGERQIHRAASALGLVPGAWIAQGGPPGSSASLFLRGAGSNQTVVLVDGVQANDPTIGGQFNFYDLDLDNVERIEVLRGAASTYYGSDALGGVVNIVTRRGRGEPHARLSAEGGSFGHYRGAASAGGGLGLFDFSLAASHDRWHNEGPHHDFRDDTFAGSVGFEPSEGTRIELRGRTFESVAHDPWDFPFGAQIQTDPNIRRTRRTSLLALSVRQDLGSAFTLKASASLFDVRSRFENGPDRPGDPVELATRSRARVRTGTLTGTWRAPSAATWLGLRAMAGIEAEDARSENSSVSAFGPGPDIDRTVRDRAAFLLLETRWFDRVTVTGGLRRDRNTFFGWETTASASGLVDLKETGSRLRVNYGEAFRAPTPVEFDDPFVGNPDLGPEKGVSLDAGVEQSFATDALVLTATWFELRGRGFIAYDPGTMRLENYARVRIRGVELASTWRPVDGVEARGWFTWQDPVNESAAPGTSDRLPGRPMRFGGADVNWRVDPFTVGLSVLASGDVPSTGRITPSGVHRDHPGRKLLVGLRGEWRASDSLTITARVENLLNETWYDDETAPNGPGRGFYLGIAFEF